ncbi:hypothetical protein C8F04DRAFT_418882 [Mycena alexandri]|uniref:Uncharacterized protein n=1 Tax=Mycena alexandri TaxID=1745969 RepID=A0AAD6WNH1_9AGAR|nr:hypothetical protein C8F04DRAFT_418882 [Mycena alexandri]
MRCTCPCDSRPAERRRRCAHPRWLVRGRSGEGQSERDACVDVGVRRAYTSAVRSMLRIALDVIATAGCLVCGSASKPCATQCSRYRRTPGDRLPQAWYVVRYGAYLLISGVDVVFVSARRSQHTPFAPLAPPSRTRDAKSAPPQRSCTSCSTALSAPPRGTPRTISPRSRAAGRSTYSSLSSRLPPVTSPQTTRRMGARCRWQAKDGNAEEGVRAKVFRQDARRRERGTGNRAAS